MKIHNLGFPKIGARRELKKALESYWEGQSTADDLERVARSIRNTNWEHQSFLDYVPVGDFSLYDQVLDMSRILGIFLNAVGKPVEVNWMLIFGRQGEGPLRILGSPVFRLRK